MANRYFQWVAGQRRGDVLVLDKIEEEDGIVYLAFKDNSRINSELVAEINVRDLTGKMMAEVESPSNIWKFQEEKSEDDKPRIEKDWESQIEYEIPSADEIANADLTGTGGEVKPRQKLKKIQLIPPRPTRNAFGKITSADLDQPVQNVSQKKQQNTSDPVWLMMEKAKKFDTPVSLELVISLPAKSLYDVANESFEDGGKKVIDYIIDNLDDTKIKESLRQALLSTYNVPTSTKTTTFGEYYTPETVEEPIVGEAKQVPSPPPPPPPRILKEGKEPPPPPESKNK